jgi:WD40 repeat protein
MVEESRQSDGLLLFFKAYMKINKTSAVMLVIFLFGYSSIQPEPVPALTPIPTNTFQPIGTSEPSPISTQTFQSKDQSSEISVISKDNQTYITGFDWDISSLIWSENGKKLIIGPQNRKLYIYDVVNKKISITPVGDSLASPLVLSPSEKILPIILCNDPNYVIGTFCNTQDYSLNLIDLETGHFIKTFHYTDQADALNLNGWLIYSPDGKLLIANNGFQIILWDIASNKKIKELFKVDPELYKTNPHYLISSASLSPDGKWLIAAHATDASTKQTFMVWDTNTWKLQRTFSGGNLGDDFSLTFSPDGSRFTTSGGSGIHEPGIWDFNTGKMMLGLGAQPWIYAIAYDSSGKYFAAGGAGDAKPNIITIYDANTGKPMRELVAGYFATTTLAFSPDGTKLAAGGGSDKPGEVIIWDTTQPWLP